MPRKIPLPTIDQAIGYRLQMLRKDWRLSRCDVALNTKVSPGIIARVELGRTPLRYEDARLILSGFFGPNPVNFKSLNPLYLAYGHAPISLNWPLFLPSPEGIGLNFNISFVSFLDLYKDTLDNLVNRPLDARIPEPWLLPYLLHWQFLRGDLQKADKALRRLETVFRDSANDLRPNSMEAQRLYAKHQSILAENNMLTDITPKSNNSEMTSEIQRLRKRLITATEKRGKKAELARELEVSLPRISEWLSGKKEPGGETTLVMLRWVQHEEREK